MGQVALTINGRIYRFDCEDTQLDQVRRLGEQVAQYVDEFSREFGQVGENRLLLLAAMRLADELAEARASLNPDGRMQPTDSKISPDDQPDLEEVLVDAKPQSQ